MAFSKESMLLSYVFQYAILVAITSNLTQYFWRKGESNADSDGSSNESSADVTPSSIEDRSSNSGAANRDFIKIVEGRNSGVDSASSSDQHLLLNDEEGTTTLSISEGGSNGRGSDGSVSGSTSSCGPSPAWSPSASPAASASTIRTSYTESEPEREGDIDNHRLIPAISSSSIPEDLNEGSALLNAGRPARVGGTTTYGAIPTVGATVPRVATLHTDGNGGTSITYEPVALWGKQPEDQIESMKDQMHSMKEVVQEAFIESAEWVISPSMWSPAFMMGLGAFFLQIAPLKNLVFNVRRNGTKLFTTVRI